MPSDRMRDSQRFKLGSFSDRIHKLNAAYPRAGTPCLDAEGDAAYDIWNGASLDDFSPPCGLEQFFYPSRLEGPALVVYWVVEARPRDPDLVYPSHLESWAVLHWAVDARPSIRPSPCRVCVHPARKRKPPAAEDAS